MDERDIACIQDKLNYRYKEPELLRQALTHSSYVNEKGLERDTGNERLEFLGDSILGMIIAGILFDHSPVLTEGEMTKLRARLVCEEALCEEAQKLDLGSYLLLGKGEANGGGRSRPSILADAFEAVIASMYLDGGIDAVREFVTGRFGIYIGKPCANSDDYKTLLQEHVQNKPGLTLAYKLISQEGPDHDKTFTVQAIINGEAKGTGTGKSKKSAEQAAAKKAFEQLTQS